MQAQPIKSLQNSFAYYVISSNATFTKATVRNWPKKTIKILSDGAVARSSVFGGHGCSEDMAEIDASTLQDLTRGASKFDDLNQTQLQKQWTEEILVEEV